jgi:phosphatidylglycerophosphatase C
VRLVVFDLDGTVTRRDTLFPYVAGYLSRERWRWPALLQVVPMAALFAVGKADHGRVKASLIKAALGGCTRAQIVDWTDKFVRELLQDGLFTDARRTISTHLEGGDRLVLMSASTDLYVPAIARSLGFHEVICTGVQWNGDRLKGDLTTPNRRGPEKARCLKELQQRYPQHTIVAYGNAKSDLEHLQLAQHGFLVNGSSSARQMATRLGVLCLSWR